MDLSIIMYIFMCVTDVLLQIHQSIMKLKEKEPIVLLKVIGLINVIQIDVDIHGEGDPLNSNNFF